MIQAHTRRYRWPLAMASVALLIGGIWSVIPSAPPAPDARRPAAAATATARATAPIPPRLEGTSEEATAAAALPATDNLDADPDDLDQELAMDPSEQLSSAERVAHARDLLEQSLRAPAAGAEASDDPAARRLQAAVALTTLRAELGATEAGRREVLAYAARLRAIAAR